MMYTEKGLEEKKKRRNKSNNNLSSFLEKIVLGIFLLANLALVLDILGFNLEDIRSKSVEVTNRLHGTQAKDIQTPVQADIAKAEPISPIPKIVPTLQPDPVRQELKENSSSDKIYKTIENSARAIEKPLNSYIDNYVLKGMKEAAIKRQQQLEQKTTKKPEKVMQITSTTEKKPSTWEECPPYQREGYDYSNAVILCRDGQKVIIPLGQKF